MGSNASKVSGGTADCLFFVPFLCGVLHVLPLSTCFLGFYSFIPPHKKNASMWLGDAGISLTVSECVSGALQLDVVLTINKWMSGNTILNTIIFSC